MRYCFILLICCLGCSCDQKVDSTRFRFPGGDPEMGKKTFTSLNCTQCHWIDDVAFPKPTDARLLRLSLGSEIRFVKSYEDIITAITNPQHVVDKQHAEFLEDLFPEVKITSFMPNMSGGITVTQLMDLVAFLDQVYQKIPDGYLKE